MNRPGSLVPEASEGKGFLRHATLLALLGGVGLVPALILVTLGLSGGSPPKVVDSPVFVLGGLLLAVVTGLLVATKWEVHQERGGIRISVTIRRQLANLAVLAIALGLSAILAIYLFTENFRPR